MERYFVKMKRKLACQKQEATMIKCACVVLNKPTLTLYNLTSSSSSLILALVMERYFVKMKRKLACQKQEATMIKCACVVLNKPTLTLYNLTSSSSSLILALIMERYFVKMKRKLACQKQEATMSKCACVVHNKPTLTLYNLTSSFSSLILALILEPYFVKKKRRLPCQ